MKRTIKHIFSIVMVTVWLTSCDDGVSLQRYFVDNQESANFISQDLPLSMVKVDASKFNNDQMEAYRSVKRLNFLGFKAQEDNKERYDIELAKVKTILNNKKYNDLIEFSDKGNNIVVKYVGDDDEADEVIVFGNSKGIGFAIVRVLGNAMSPDKMITLASVLRDSNFEASQVGDLMNFFQ
ncbi:DUF4252 domain-containing protein [Aestuariivivens sediminis]|uniref:DUF4252 domain-containing protein n=1 Tax=Aestuariivivens sediminis TaxID=2913557 RepID=UPI001F5AD25B|nr:DUF4252 domain-containing protein [Aestuariivivens sediminis]